MPLDDDLLVRDMLEAAVVALRAFDSKDPYAGMRAALAIARPRVLEEVHRWEAEGLCRHCGKDELCWEGLCLECAERHAGRTYKDTAREKVYAEIERLAAKIGRALAVEPGQSCASCGETGTAHKRTCSQWVGPGGFAASTAATAQLGQGIPGPHVPPPAILPAAPTAQDTSEPTFTVHGDRPPTAEEEAMLGRIAEAAASVARGPSMKEIADGIARGDLDRWVKAVQPPAPAEAVTCPDCEGTGIYPPCRRMLCSIDHDGDRCHECNGTGKQPSDSEGPR